MKADWEDAPIRQWEKRNSRQSLLLATIAGSILTGGGLFLGSKYLPKTPPAPVETESAEYVPRYDLDNPPVQTGPTPEERFWADRQKANEQKENVFNDYNYTPKNPINVVSTQGLRESKAYQQRAEPERQTRQRSIITVHETIKSWDSHTNYHWASWTFVDGRIDGSSVCTRYRRGSIEFRECRKAAKQYFHEQCRKPDNESLKDGYCSAARSFSPMS